MNGSDEREAPQPPTSIFGTDGVRDRPGTGYLEERAVRRIAAAAAEAAGRSSEFREDFPRGPGRLVVVGRDTRASGPALVGTLAEAFLSLGWDVADAGVLPSPGVARLASLWDGVAFAVVVSASHNPADYNGIKFFAPTGAKVSPAFELAVSEAFWRGGGPRPARRPGRLSDRAEEAFEMYVRSLVSACRRPERLRGRTVCVDGANGAAFRAGPETFRRLGLRVREIACEPDGSNINLGCGALHPEAVASSVRDQRSDFGFSFDGDGDRAIAVAASGKILDGDHMLFLAGKSYLREGRLPRRTVVATVMSNLGLEVALRERGIALERTEVGDRAVYLAMVRGGHPVGGEQSGHLIFLDRARTGDGLLSAVSCLDMLEGDALDLEGETAALRRCPQVLRNVPIPGRPALDSLPEVAEALGRARAALGPDGRVLLRYSGTEPVLRVMVEGADRDLVEEIGAALCESVRKSLPG